MSIQQIYDYMKELYRLHQNLLDLSKEKTEVLKSSEIDGFQEVLLKERKHVRSIEQLEEKRLEATNQWFQEQGIQEDQTMKTILEHIEDSAEKEHLQKQYENFIYLLADLKQQENLNRELTQQSLQFTELQLDILQPSTKNMNYGKNERAKDSSDRPVFDSKA